MRASTLFALSAILAGSATATKLKFTFYTGLEGTGQRVDPPGIFDLMQTDCAAADVKNERYIKSVRADRDDGRFSSVSAFFGIEEPDGIYCVRAFSDVDCRDSVKTLQFDKDSPEDSQPLGDKIGSAEAKDGPCPNE